MLDFEETLLQRLNQAGVVATPRASGSSTPTIADHRRFGQAHHKGRSRRITDPYGVATVDRHTTNHTYTI